MARIQTTSESLLEKAARFLLRDYTGAGNASPGGSFPSAQFGRLMGDWLSNGLSADRLLDGNIKVMRDRSRQLARANDYYNRFLGELKSNVLGPNGIQSNFVIRDLQTDKIDAMDSKSITKAWDKFNEEGTFEVSGEYCGQEAQEIGLESWARDGEFLCRAVRGWDNEFKIAFQFWESDLLDHKYNAELPNGNKVRLGVERDKWGRRINYHVFSEHPGDYYWGGNRTPIPAKDIIHVMCANRFGQSRGYPKGQTSFRKLHMLEQYDESELISARIESCKMGFFVPKTPTDWDGEMDSNGELVMDMEPGIFEELPQGMELQQFDPQHPNKNYPAFRKEMLRGIAGGLLTSYNFLAQDLESVNYSSLRAGTMDVRDLWKIIQIFYGRKYLSPQFRMWLEMALMAGAIKGPTGISLPMSKWDKFNKPGWRNRRWGLLDPIKETQANALAADSLFKSRAQIVEESGDYDGSYEQLLDEIAAEQDQVKKKKILAPGIDGITPGKPQPAKPTPNDPDGEKGQGNS